MPNKLAVSWLFHGFQWFLSPGSSKKVPSELSYSSRASKSSSRSVELLKILRCVPNNLENSCLRAENSCLRAEFSWIFLKKGAERAMKTAKKWKRSPKKGAKGAKFFHLNRLLFENIRQISINRAQKWLEYRRFTSYFSTHF